MLMRTDPFRDLDRLTQSLEGHDVVCYESLRSLRYSS